MAPAQFKIPFQNAPPHVAPARRLTAEVLGPWELCEAAADTAPQALVKCQFPVDEPARERSSVIDYVWRLPDTDRLPGQ
jgi:hypothetical protein